MHFHILQYETENLLEIDLGLSKLHQLLLNKTSLLQI